jgi:hypothetical protein
MTKMPEFGFPQFHHPTSPLLVADLYLAAGSHSPNESPQTCLVAHAVGHAGDVKLLAAAKQLLLKIFSTAMWEVGWQYHVVI